MDVGPEDRQLQQASAPLTSHGRVGGVAVVRGDGAEDRDPHVRCEQDHRHGGHEGERYTGRPPLSRGCVEGARDERGDGEAGDRQQPLGHAREAERREGVPERLVQGRVRAECEHVRNDGCEREQEGEAAPAPDRPQARQRQDRREPAHEDELFDPGPDSPRDDVRDLRRVVPDLCERASAPGDRALDHGLLDDDRRRRGAERSRRALPPVRARNACPRVPECEGDRSHRQVDLAGERDRGQGERRPHEAPPLEGEQRRREEERDQPEEVPGRLPHPVGRQREDEAARERRPAPEAESPQPPAGEPAGRHEREQHDEVVRPNVPEEHAERPEGEAEEPPLQVRRRARLGAERIRVGPRRRPAVELVAREPERPAELQVVSRRGLAAARSRPGEVAAVDVAHRRPCRPEPAGDVERER